MRVLTEDLLFSGVVYQCKATRARGRVSVSPRSQCSLAGLHSSQTKQKGPQLTFPITRPQHRATAARAFLWSAGPESSKALNKTRSVFGKYYYLGVQRATRRGEVTRFQTAQ